MNIHTLDTAMAEARRFIERGEALQQAMADGVETRRTYVNDHPKECGAVKRASMDLTRALADVRRPG